MASQAIKLSAKERTNLRFALRSHPDVLSQVHKLSDISALNKAALLEAAGELGIDVEAAKAGDYSSMAPWDSPEGIEQRRRSDEKPAFFGSFEEPMTFVLLGQSITRTLRVSYELTPSWPYIDDETGEEVQGWEQSSMRYDFLVRREVGLIGSGPAGKARQRHEKEEWVNCTELFMHEMLGDQFDESIDDKIDEACLRENKLRKQRHGKSHLDKEAIWRFEVGNIVVICEEEEANFIDPLVHMKDKVADLVRPFEERQREFEAFEAAVEAGKIELTHMTATITRNGNEIGHGSRRDCIRPCLDPSECMLGGEDFEERLRLDRAIRLSYRNEAVRRALKEAREYLEQLKG
ncbi:hypothetical protein [Novosphingobium sp. BW1]|uniref:hypothetical protein n=1 Tax=Novosphingobium sp. BW1 TaxID=2592621 RepID=UPI0011DEDDE9|nr:hypothetical protein [Novosphingobium sp. BW1]TYC78519.1 hypothetical protein FMM79_21045 [Novosphingobium sp. BW1]